MRLLVVGRNAPALLKSAQPAFIYSIAGSLHTSTYNGDVVTDRTCYHLDAINKDEPKFDKILIANRGEIACRVIKTARAMGIKTVAVHSTVDSLALHVKMADEAVCVGPAATNQSYLRMDKILQAVKDTGAQAVHPGYGFLSENTEFARQLTEIGGTFIGPNSRAIKDMGDKIESKRIATKAKVNMIPGYDGEIDDPEHCVKVSNDIGYPVMIKASAGGGGKGMRVAWNDDEARRFYKLSKDEAKSSFGDDRMLVEKFIDNPRHIEMQVICDKHGNAIWLNERECSIQRRNQKVIEEAPSSFIDPDTRKRMGEQACSLATHVGYDSAGTVEFLVDSKKNFYFLEMNTRLQVEHPITEYITGVDLVQQMLRVAYGHKLNFTQQDIGIHGWAFESRVYAEDPYKGFGLPSVGRLSMYREPLHIEGVRCDSGIREGSEISIYYDPLICKLVTHGDNRNQAMDRMRQALDHYVIRGVTHNIPLLRDIIDEKRFRSGNITTKYLPETYPDGFKGTVLSDGEKRHLIAVAASMQAFKEARAHQIVNDKRRETAVDPYDRAYKFYVQLKDPDHEDAYINYPAEVLFTGGDHKSTKVTIDGVTIDLTGDLHMAQAILQFELSENGQQSHFDTQIYDKGARKLTLIYKGSPFQMKLNTPMASQYLQYMPAKPKIDWSSIVVAPMPGLIKSVAVKVGDMVSEGQEMAVMEAMKMQNSLTAGKTGKVKTVNAKEGQTVDEGTVLVELE